MKKSKSNIKELRKLLGLSEDEVSEASHVPICDIQKLEKGEKNTFEPFLKDWLEREANERKAIEDAIKALKREFKKGGHYTINDNKIQSNDFIFEYLSKDGIHHVFREVHGGWTRTYTDAQLIDKIIKEV